MVIFHSYIGLPEGMYIVFPEFGRRQYMCFSCVIQIIFAYQPCWMVYIGILNLLY